MEFWNFDFEIGTYQSPGQYGKTSKDVRLTTRRFAWRNDIEGKEIYRIEPENKDDVQTGIFDSPVIVLQANW